MVTRSSACTLPIFHFLQTKACLAPFLTVAWAKLPRQISGKIGPFLFQNLGQGGNVSLKQASVPCSFPSTGMETITLENVLSIEFSFGTALQAIQHLTHFFFPGSADDAQRLGPEIWVSSNNTNKDSLSVQTVQKTRQWQQRTQPRKDTHRTTCKSPSQICVSPQKKQQSNSRPGPEPKQNKQHPDAT
jgi:hypothetical protein